MENIKIINTIGYLSYIIALIVRYIIVIYFINRFLDFKYKLWKSIFFIIFLMLFNILIYKMQSPFSFIINDFFWFIFLCCFCKGNVFLKVYTAITPSSILLLTYITLLSFDFKISHYISALNMKSVIDFTILLIINLIRESISLLPLFIILKKIGSFLNFKEDSISTYEAIYLLIPSLASYSLALIFYFVQAVKINSKNYFLFSIFPKIYTFVPFVSMGLLVSIILNSYIFKKVIDSKELVQKNLLMEQQYKLQINHSNNLESLYRDIRSVRHDMNNHMNCLKSLADNGNIEEIKKYLSTLGQTIDKLNYKIKTGNVVSDAVLNEKFSIAKMVNIDFNCDFLMPSHTIIDSVDLCTILSNSLDNAIEACMAINDKNIRKYINITAYLREPYLIIEVTNSSNGKIKYENNKISSTKYDKLNHGIGILNMEKAAKKYNGIFDIIQEKNIVTTNIMLKIR